MELARQLDHARRKVEPHSSNTPLMQIARDLAGATADLADKPLVAHRCGETLQHLTVQRHALQFVIETPHIFLGDQVVALTCLLKILSHTCFLLWCLQLR